MPDVLILRHPPINIFFSAITQEDLQSFQGIGFKHTGKETAAVFGDYDNDGYPDLYIIREEGDILYRNNTKGEFEDVTGKAAHRKQDRRNKRIVP